MPDPILLIFSLLVSYIISIRTICELRTVAALPPIVWGRKHATTLANQARILGDILIKPYQACLREIVRDFSIILPNRSHAFQEAGTALPSMTSILLDVNRQKDDTIEHEKSIQAATAIAYIGTNTSLVSLSVSTSFILSRSGYGTRVLIPSSV